MLCFQKRKGNARISIDPVLESVWTNQVIYQAKKRIQASLNFAKPDGDKKATLIMLTWECNRVVIGYNQLSGQQPDQAQTKSSQGFFSIVFLQKGARRSSDEKGDRAKWLDATDSLAQCAKYLAEWCAVSLSFRETNQKILPQEN